MKMKLVSFVSITNNTSKPIPYSAVLCDDKLQQQNCSLCRDTKQLLRDVLNVFKILPHLEIFRHIESESLLTTDIVKVTAGKNA